MRYVVLNWAVLLAMTIPSLVGLVGSRTYAGMQMLATADVENVDVTRAVQEGVESKWDSSEDIGTVARLKIMAGGKCFLTGRAGVIIPLKETPDGVDVDKETNTEILIFNKGHKITVTMVQGAVAMLRGKRVRAKVNTTFLLADGDDSQFNSRLQQGILELVSQAGQPPPASPRSGTEKPVTGTWKGKATDGRMWTHIEFAVDADKMEVGPFEIVFGFEPDESGALKLSLREVGAFDSAQPFSVESKPGDWGLANLSDAQISFNMSGSGLLTLGVKGRFLTPNLAEGTITTPIRSLTGPSGVEGKPCLKWKATPSSTYHSH